MESGTTLLNLIEVETRWGYRAFELRQGDLLDLGEQVDVLVVSAYSHDLTRLAADPGGYLTIANTLVGALFLRRGIDLARLATEPSMDLTAALSCWVSERIDAGGIGRILCVQDIGVARGVEVTFDNVFGALALLEAKGQEVRTLGLPLLGAGGAGLAPDLVMRSVLAAVKRHLGRIEHLERVLFVERDADRARAFDRAMDEALKRERVVLPRGAVVDSLRREIQATLAKARVGMTGPGLTLVDDLGRVVADQNARSFEIGILCRRFLEHVLTTLPGRHKGPLWQQIEGLGEAGVADWIRSYMHTLRIFGNEAAHERHAETRRPYALTEQDLALCLFCLERVLSFWVTERSAV